MQELSDFITRINDFLKNEINDSRIKIYAEELENVNKKLERPIVVSFVGAISTGKTLLVDSLIGRETNVENTVSTKAVTKFIYADEPMVRIYYKNGSVKDENVDFVKALDDKQSIRIDYMEYGLPLDILRRVNVIDTPGFSEGKAIDAGKVNAVFEESDNVFWVFDYNDASRESYIKFIKDFGVAKKTIGVINKIDSDENAQEFLNQQIDRLKIHMSNVFGVSAVKGIQARKENNEELLIESGFDSFFAFINDSVFSYVEDSKINLLLTTLTRTFVELDYAEKVVTHEMNKKDMREEAIFFRNNVNDFYKSLKNVCAGFVSYCESRDCVNRDELRLYQLLSYYYGIENDENKEYAIEKLSALPDSSDTLNKEVIIIHYYDQKDYPKMLLWAKKAALGNSGKAFFFLGLSYQFGYGKDISIANAKDMYNVAIKNGDVFAAKYLEDIENGIKIQDMSASNDNAPTGTKMKTNNKEGSALSSILKNKGIILGVAVIAAGLFFGSDFLGDDGTEKLAQSDIKVEEKAPEKETKKVVAPKKVEEQAKEEKKLDKKEKAEAKKVEQGAPKAPQAISDVPKQKEEPVVVKEEAPVVESTTFTGLRDIGLISPFRQDGNTLSLGDCVLGFTQNAQGNYTLVIKNSSGMVVDKALDFNCDYVVVYKLDTNNGQGDFWLLQGGRTDGYSGSIWLLAPKAGGYEFSSNILSGTGFGNGQGSASFISLDINNGRLILFGKELDRAYENSKAAIRWDSSREKFTVEIGAF